MIDERPIAALGSRQHGVVTTHQLTSLGISADARAHRLAIGRLELVHRHVYRIGGSVDTFEQRALAACLAVGGLVAASHRCAARLWGLELPGAAPIELTVPLGRSGRVRGVQIHRSGDLVREHLVTQAGIPTTDPHRMLVDLGAVVPMATVAHSLDDLVGRKVVTLAGVRRALDALTGRGRRGSGVLQEVLDSRTTDERMGRTRLEALLIDLATEARIPPLVFQYPIVVGGRRRRIDFACPDLRVAIEVDGYESHTRYDVFEDDRVRGNELELAGWMVLHFTWYQVRRRRGHVVSVLRRAFNLEAA
jgi:very-short-patch-repair endonuclease